LRYSQVVPAFCAPTPRKSGNIQPPVALDGT
jgi:hypothetical protein